MNRPASWRRIRQLVDEHYDALYRYAYRLSGTAADAEDLTQEAFCTAQMQWHQLRDPERAKPWLFAVLRNAFLQRIRAEQTRRAMPLDSAGELAARAQADEWPVGPDELQAALNELPEPFRTPIILFYFEEFSYRDIAEQLNVPIGTVMSRLARAKAHLRRRLAPDNAVENVTRELR